MGWASGMEDILTRYKVYFTIENENLVFDPCNNKSNIHIKYIIKNMIIIKDNLIVEQNMFI